MGNKPLKCITQSHLPLQLHTNDSLDKRTWESAFLNKNTLLADKVCFEVGLILFVASSFQGSLEEIQGILNTTEISLHQLTALVDCRSLHMVRGGWGGQLPHICPKTLLPLIHADVSAPQFGPVKRIPFFRGRLPLSVEVRLGGFFVCV